MYYGYEKTISLILGNTRWKALRDNGQHVCHSQMVQEKNSIIYIFREEEKEASKCGKISTSGEYGLKVFANTLYYYCNR